MTKLILTHEVSNLGEPGDVVTVKDGYARNYLLPRGYAIVASKGAEKNVRTIQRAQQFARPLQIGIGRGRIGDEPWPLLQV